MNPAEQKQLRDTKYWWIIWVRHSKLSRVMVIIITLENKHVRNSDIVTKGRTIRKVMGGMGKKPKKNSCKGKCQEKKIHANQKVKKKKFMQKEGPIVTFIYSAFHKAFDRRFAKFVVNFISSLRTWEFQYVTVNQRANFESVKKG